MTHDQFDILLELIKTLAREAVNDARPGHDRRCNNATQIASEIEYARDRLCELGDDE